MIYIYRTKHLPPLHPDYPPRVLKQNYRQNRALTLNTCTLPLT